MISYKTIILTLIMSFCLVNKANSAVLDAQFLCREIKKDIIERLKNGYEGETEVEITALPYQTIHVPEGDVEIKTEAGYKNLNSSIVKVKILVNNIKVKSFGVRVSVKLYDKVWVARGWIKKGETLKNLKLEKKEISSGLSGVLKKDFNPGKYLARRNIKPGEVINAGYIEEVPTIVKNSPVSLVFKTPLVSVTIPAVAVTSGKIGDYIRVKNKRYKKNYVGKIIGKNIVLVNI